MNKATRTWIILMVISCASVALARFVPVAAIVATLVIILGYVKARMIFVNFMGVERNMMPIRPLLEIWGIYIVLVLLIPFWLGAL